MINIPPPKSAPQYNPEIADTYENTSLLAQRTINVQNATKASDWDSLRGSTRLVHAISDENQKWGTELFEQPAQKLLSTWRLISTSLVNVSNIGSFPAGPAKHGGYVERATGCFGEIGLILDVPSQNIYGTHAADVRVDNFAGKTKPQKLSRHLRSDVNMTGDRVQGGFARFVPATQLLEETKTYNEVLVIGSIDANLRATDVAPGKVEVLGIISARSKKYLNPKREKQVQENHEKHLKKLQAVNPDLKIFRV